MDTSRKSFFDFCYKRFQFSNIHPRLEDYLPCIPLFQRLVQMQNSRCDRMLKNISRYRSYSDNDMQQAIRAVVENRCTITAASRTFGVPETTLKRKIPTTHYRRQHRTLLTEAQESYLVKLMLDRLESGRPLTKSEVCGEAKRILDSYSPRASSPGWWWLVYFLKRNPLIPKDYFQPGNRQ